MWHTNLYPEHLYIHWPFCKNKCHYCDFVAFEKHEGFEKSYHDALVREIELFAKKFPKESILPIKTIFLGGGTPSIYPEELIKDLSKVLKANFNLEQLIEFTIEVNPGGISEEKIAAWKEIGINRMSVGVQVLDDAVLKRLNRMQTRADVEELFSIAPKYFKNISMDLIIGLPGVSASSWRETLEYAASAPISHVSVYFLTVHEKTPLYFRLKKRELKIPDDDTYLKLYEESVDYLEQAGFIQYEISNFAKPGYESIHNKAYWERKIYKGFGIGAASFDGLNRFTNVKNLSNYINYSSTSSSWPILSFESLNEDQKRLELLMLSLRQKKGVDLHTVLYYGDSEKKAILHSRIELLKKGSLIDIEDGYLKLTRKGMALENEVILSLFS